MKGIKKKTVGRYVLYPTVSYAGAGEFIPSVEHLAFMCRVFTMTSRPFTKLVHRCTTHTSFLIKYNFFSFLFNSFSDVRF